jgi:hypothetical protein
VTDLFQVIAMTDDEFENAQAKDMKKRSHKVKFYNSEELR